jgi:hypothetical protein
MSAQDRPDEEASNRSVFWRNLRFPYALFSLPKTAEAYRSACIGISVYSLGVILLFMLFAFSSKVYIVILFLAVFALLSAVSLIRMAWLKQIDSVGLYSFTIGDFGSFIFVLLVLAIGPYDGRPGSGLWLATGLLFIAFWTPFFVRFFLHGRKLLNNANG